MKISSASLAIAATALALAVAPTAAYASPSASTQAQSASQSAKSAQDAQAESAMRSWMTTNGIAAATQDSLIAKLASGKRWDSMTGATPVKVTETESGGFKKIRSTFADGSVDIAELQKPAEFSTMASAEGCSVSSGSGYVAYRNCVIKGDNPIVSARFSATFQIVKGKVYMDSINSAGGGVKDVRGASCTTPTVSPSSSKETLNGPAVSTLFMECTGIYAGGFGNWTSTLALRVGNDSYQVINNL